MKIATRFPIAVHTLLCIDYFDGAERTTSDFIAGSVNVNPVVIRQVLQKLKAAGLVEVRQGQRGAHLGRPLEDITLLDVFQAVEAVDGSLFDFHDSPNPDCPVGRRIKPVLGQKLDAAQKAMEEELAATTLADLAAQV
ncbi:Rrf2 family transcriptional regulator [uncultured Adlercreutzia sp.]|uniref:Rrf2 family transcriptional regulator n=1 Tax=uncultured Adlercreutzia sp. TaxID=875803 RepID=UPI0025F5AEA8|nr:Rrf2 family transcriptional regulator [uncultured Adlercreutzia sp.]MCI9262467.1 Rrf2 family transcriptional regulator [Eggerthellaceae bacterium]